MDDQVIQASQPSSIHKYPDSLQKIKLIAQRTFWSKIDKYLNSYYYAQKIRIEDEFFLLEEQQTLKRFYQNNQHKNKMGMLTSYYKYHIEMPRIFIDRVSWIMEENYQAKRDLQYIRVTNQLKKQRDFAKAYWQNQVSSFNKGLNDSQQNQKQKQFSSFNLLDDLTLSRRSIGMSVPASELDNSQDVRTTLMRMKQALLSTGTLDLPSNQLFYQPKKTPRQKNKANLFACQNKQNGEDKNSTDSELKVVSKSILVSKKMVKNICIARQQLYQDNQIRMGFIKKLAQKVDSRTRIPDGQGTKNDTDSQCRKIESANNSKSTCSKSIHKIQSQVSQDKNMQRDHTCKYSQTNNKKMFNNLIEMKKRIK